MVAQKQGLTLYVSSQTTGGQNSPIESVPLMVQITAEVSGYSIEIADLFEEIEEVEADAEIYEEEVREEDETEEDVVVIAINEIEQNDKETSVGLFIEIAHSRAVIAFIIFLMAMQWVLAFVAFMIALVTITQKRAVRVTNFSWLGALLFAQIALRNAMPGTPPVGTLGDSMSFFWVLGIITISMLIMVGTWIIRGE